MANRILIGNRSTGGYGLYVSKTGDDVLTTTNPMAFDPRTGTGWAVKDYGQFEIEDEATQVTKTHNLGYAPLVALRWSPSISSGVATTVFNPCWSAYAREREGQGGGVDVTESEAGCRWEHVPITGSDPFDDGSGGDNSNSIIIQNKAADDYSSSIYVAYIIFYEKDFTGGRGI